MRCENLPLFDHETMHGEIGLEFEFDAEHRHQHDKGFGIGEGGTAFAVPHWFRKVREFEKSVEFFFLLAQPCRIEFGNRWSGGLCVHAPSIAQMPILGLKTPRLLDYSKIFESVSSKLFSVK